MTPSILALTPLERIAFAAIAICTAIAAVNWWI